MLYRIRRWCSWREWRYQLRYRAWGMIQRSRRGWADHDVWWMSGYLAQVTAEMLRHLANTSHGWPGRHPGQTDNDCFETFEDWQAWLRDKAEWFEWYAADEMLWDSATMSTEECRRLMDEYMARHIKFRNEVLPDFVKYWGHLWD